MSYIPIVNRTDTPEPVSPPCAPQRPLRARPAHRRHIAVLASCTFAVGALAVTAATPAMAGCNSGINANTDLLSSVNCQGYANPAGATAVGLNAVATGSASSAFGSNAFAKGQNATAIGFNTGSSGIVLGATNVGAFSGNEGPGIYSTAGGFASQASGSNSSAFGLASKATGLDSSALGRDSNAGGTNHNSGTIAIGVSSQAGIGKVGQTNATAVGATARANAASSSAFGFDSSASGASSLALGPSASATRTGSVAIGNGSLADVANTVSVGRAKHERRIVNVANGVGAYDAVNLAQVQALIAAAPPRSAADTALLALVHRLEGLVAQQQERIARLEGARTATAAPAAAD